ncbi:MAG: D-Ala-D-Ala carboxypeptidase family metallohydrolase, partial [Candidatus Paceibacterota bacterium]
MRVMLRYSLLLSATAFLFTPLFTSALITPVASCPPDSRKATADDAVVKNGQVQLGTCYNPNDPNLGQSVEEAKGYLLSIARGLPGTKAPPDQSHINNLNSTFAVCAANFLKAFSKTYGPVTLSSAFRCGPNSPASITCNRGENAAAGGASSSNHQLGLAIDVSPASGDFQRIWNFAKANPQFGVCFPYLGSDRPHMALAGTNTGEASKCAAQGITRICSGAPNFDIKSVPPGFGTVGTSDETGPGYTSTLPSGQCIVSTAPVMVTPCAGSPSVPRTLPPP